MGRLLGKPMPVADWVLDCGTRVTRPWVRDGFDGYAPGMAGHLVGAYYGVSQQCMWAAEGRRRSARLAAGTLTIVPEAHDGHWLLAGPVEVAHVYLTEQRLQACADLIPGAAPVELLGRLGVEDRLAAHLVQALAAEANSVDPASRLFVEQAVDLLCTRLIRSHSSYGGTLAVEQRRGLADWQRKRVVDYMEDHIDQAIGLDELAVLVRLGRFHFCTAFRLATGLAPHAYLTELRIRRARTLLADPGARIGDVALAVGYQTASAFAASFRKLVGVTPSAYRRGQGQVPAGKQEG